MGRGRKIDVTASEMMALRNEGYSNKDIANLLEINPLTVRRYIGCQPQRRMENMAAFKEKPKEKKEPETVETPEIKRAVDEIVCQNETIASKSGSIMADVDYTKATVRLYIDDLRFDELPEFATFVVGMVERIKARG
jgi:predicted transcriptional regulator